MSSVLKRIEPNSCRIVWNEPTGESFSLNLDRFGNYSFTISDRLREMYFSGISNILSYLDNINAFDISSNSDPLSRSMKSLEGVE